MYEEVNKQIVSKNIIMLHTFKCGKIKLFVSVFLSISELLFYFICFDDTMYVLIIANYVKNAI